MEVTVILVGIHTMCLLVTKMSLKASQMRGILAINVPSALQLKCQLNKVVSSTKSAKATELNKQLSASDYTLKYTWILHCEILTA